MSATLLRQVSLAAIESGERFVIGRILSERLEQSCMALGIAKGVVIYCSASSPWRLYLRNASGRTIALDRDQARYIEVERL